MTTTGWLDFLEAAAPREAVSPVEVARWQADRADRRSEADEAEEAARAEDEAEARAFRFRTVGIEPGQTLAVALRGVDEDEQYEAARAVMQKIERRRESRRRVAEFQGKQLAEATQASRASREPPGIQAANSLAARLAGPAPRASRPFARRGAVPGADDPVQCPECAAVGASAVESFLIHHEDQGPVPEDFTAADLAPYQTRYSGYSAGMIRR